MIGTQYVLNWKSESFADNSVYTRLLAAVSFPYLVFNYNLSKGFLFFGVADFASAMIYLFLRRNNKEKKN